MSDDNDNGMMTADKLDQLIRGVAKKPPTTGGDPGKDDAQDANTPVGDEEITLELGDDT